MAEIKIKDVPSVQSIKDSDKFPLSIGDDLAHTVTAKTIKEFCGGGGLTRVTWDDIQGKPEFKPIATSGKYGDLTETPLIPTDNNQLTNGSGFQTLDDVNKTLDLRGFLTRSEADTTFSPITNVVNIDATPLTQLTVESNKVYLVDCSRGDIERIEILNVLDDFNTTKIYIINISKPIQLILPKEAIRLTPIPQNIEVTDCLLEVDFKFFKYFGTGNGIK